MHSTAKIKPAFEIQSYKCIFKCGIPTDPRHQSFSYQMKQLRTCLQASEVIHKRGAQMNPLGRSGTITSSAASHSLSCFYLYHINLLSP